MKSKQFFLFVFIAILTGFMLGAKSTLAACNFHALMTASTKDLSNFNTTCTITGVEGIDKPGNSETSVVNSAVLSLVSGSSITVNNGGVLNTGTLTLSGGSIAMQAGSQLKLNSPLWVTDADGDGWPNDFTLYTATSSGRRRLGLMLGFTGGDCSDSAHSPGNSCVLPTYGDGTDGSVTISSNKNINTDVIAAGRSYADGVVYAVTALGSNTITTSATPNGIVVGDEILIMNMRGDGTNFGNVGKYENFLVQGVSSNTLTLSGSLTKIYGATNSNSTLTGQKIVVQRVPNYTNVYIYGGETLTASAWNGTTGGIVAFRATGDVYVDGTISVSSLGYRGGVAGSTYPPTSVIPPTGESYCGYTAGTGGWAPSYVGGTGDCGGGGGSGGMYPNNGSHTAAGSGVARGGAGGAGGAAIGYASGTKGGGAGGSGYGTAGGGGTGGNTTVATDGGTNTSGGGGAGSNGTSNNSWAGGGGGGGTYGVNTLATIFHGSGGSTGGWANVAGADNDGLGGSGGSGGGIIMVWADYFRVEPSGSVVSNGANGGAGTTQGNIGSGGGGGGASGGSIFVTANTFSNGASITATGGSGTSQRVQSGAGGSGRIAVYYDTSMSAGTISPAAYTSQF